MSPLKFPKKQLSYQDQQFTCRHCCTSQGHWPLLAAARSGFNHVIRGRARAIHRVTSTLTSHQFPLAAQMGLMELRVRMTQTARIRLHLLRTDIPPGTRCHPGEAFLASHSPSGMPVNMTRHPLVLVWKHRDCYSQLPRFFFFDSICLFEKMTLILLIRDSYFIKKHLFSITQITVFYSVREFHISCFQTTLVF